MHSNRGLAQVRCESRIPLEMCPISNVRTGVVASIDDHPIRQFFERGLVVTVNTDDPKMFGNSLADEYRLLEERLGFSRDEIRQLIVNAIRASWLDHQRKQALEREITTDAAWLLHCRLAAPHALRHPVSPYLPPATCGPHR